MYKQYADKLLDSGHVYHCFCSNEVIVFSNLHLMDITFSFLLPLMMKCVLSLYV